jgi:D-alanine transaminase
MKRIFGCNRSVFYWHYRAHKRRIGATMLVYFNRKFIEKERVAISPDDRGFLFADGVYEVIRSYNGKLFKCAEHLQRFAHALTELRIQFPDVPALKEVAERLIADNELQTGDALVYTQITRGAAPRTHEFPPPETPATVYVQARPYTGPTELQQTGAKAILAPDQRWGRCNLKTIGLLPNVLAHQRAQEAGAFEAIFCGDGLLHEGTHSSILCVKDDVLICPPLTNRMLPSVTRSVVIRLAEQESIEVEERPCREGELLAFDEIMMLGTGVEIVPIVSINGKRIRHGHPGRITKHLQSAFRTLTRG